MGRERLDRLVNRCRGAKRIVVCKDPDAYGEFSLRMDEYEGRRIGAVQGKEEAEYVSTNAKLPLVWLCPEPPPLPAHRLSYMRHAKLAPTELSRAEALRTGRRAFNKALGDIARERGDERERKALASLGVEPLPVWLKSVRARTPEEDRRGIDLVGESDVGQLHVQVKGCKAAARNFHERNWNRALIEVVIVAGHEDDKVIRDRVVNAFGRARDKVREHRSKRA